MLQQQQEDTSLLDDIVDDNMFYRTYFGKSSDYYAERYEKISAGETVIFNSYAFFLGFFWLAYRKMYVELVGIMLVVAIMDTLLLFVLEIDNPSLDRILNIIWAGIMGSFANYFYIRKAKRVVETAKNTYTNTSDQLDYLEKEGGVSYIGPVIVGVFSIILIFGFIALSEYMNGLYY